VLTKAVLKILLALNKAGCIEGMKLIMESFKNMMVMLLFLGEEIIINCDLFKGSLKVLWE